MTPQQLDVLLFHRHMGHVIGDSFALRDVELRARLIEEEARETVEAMRAGDLVETIDGLCDLVYVALGAACACGVDLEPYFAEVHRTNMAKDPDLKDETGKLIKPPGWVPPNIRRLLDKGVGALGE